MQTERTFIDELKHQFRYGGMTIKLLFANVIVFVLISILHVIGRLGGSGLEESMYWLTSQLFGMPTGLGDFITHPWTLITSIFAHVGFLHFAMNMIFLYTVGKLFEQILNQKRLLYTYILGGIFGGIFEIIATFLPAIPAHSVIGASGAIMAIFLALAFYRPNLKVSLLGIIEVRLIYLGILFFVIDLVKLGMNDGTAHFAHLGGAVLGMISVQQIHSPGNIVNVAQRLWDSLRGIFSSNGSSQVKMKVHKNDTTRRPKTDDQYNLEAKERQNQIDRILDKISKSGYDSLTKKEKDFLFKQSKNG